MGMVITNIQNKFQKNIACLYVNSSLIMMVLQTIWFFNNYINY